MAQPSPGEGQSFAARGVAEIDILWITAGLGCDGDTIAMTAATQPSIEDIVLGGLPWIPEGELPQSLPRLRKRRRIPAPFPSRGRRQLAPFILVVEGSIPNENEQGGRLLGVVRHRRRHRPADHDLRMDRSSGAESLGRGRGRNLRHLRRDSRDGGQSHRLHGPGRLPGLAMEIASRHSDRVRSRMSGAAGQLHGDAALPALSGGGPRADDPAR